MLEKMNDYTVNALDYNGSQADKSKTGGWLPAALILGIELCERLSTMGIAVNLVTYLTGTMHLSSATSANTVTDFLGTSFLLCLLGGFLTDSFLGRHKTIAIFAIIQTLVSVSTFDMFPMVSGNTDLFFNSSKLVNNVIMMNQGTSMLAISTRLPQLRPPPCNANVKTTCKQASGPQMAVLYVSLYLIALGTGGLKSSVSGFGTDQFDENDDKEKAQMAYFFNRLFFFISIGTLMAVTVLVYIQDEVGRSWGYGICSISMFIAIIIFLSGTKRYRYKKSLESPIVHILQVIVAAMRKTKLQVPNNAGLLYEYYPESLQIHHTDQFHCLDKATIATEEDRGINSSSPPNPWKLCPVTRVEEVKMIIKLLPVWATTIIFWTTYAQMITFSVEQASTMYRSMGNFEIPAGSLTVFFVAAILITLAVYDRLIMPFWKRWRGKPGFTNLQKIAVGLVLSTLGMAAAALTEMKRLSVATSIDQPTSTLPISVFLLIPQFFLVGSGEAFIYTGQLAFFITQSPKGMKTMSTGLFLSTLSLGFFFSSLLVSIVKRVTTSSGGQGWVGDNINNGRLDCFYGLLSILSFINFGLYLLCATW